jgi:ribosomal protein L29
MAHIKSRDLDQMTPEQRERRLLELKEELLQLCAQ